MNRPRGGGRQYQAAGVMLNSGGWHDVAPSPVSKLSLREATTAVIKPQGAVARRGCRATAPVAPALIHVKWQAYLSSVFPVYVKREARAGLPI
jgi:hypothetical protein